MQSVQHVDSQLTLNAAALASAAPAQWKEFLAALREHANTRREMCVMSARDLLEVNQGRARECVELLAKFSNAVQDADRVTQRRHKI